MSLDNHVADKDELLFPMLAGLSVGAAGLSDPVTRLHEILTEAGLDEDQASGAVQALRAFVLGFLSSEILAAG